MFKSRKKNASIRKKPVVEDKDSGGTSDSSISSADVRTAVMGVKRKRHGIDVGVEYKSNPSKALTQNDDATKVSSLNDLEKKLEVAAVQGDASDSVYRGQKGYKLDAPQHESAYIKKRAGPVRAPTNIRSVTVIDYQPDVCKDYKQTGYCGFGDSCIFLHDRSDYKAGWQIDREWEEVQRKAGGHGNQPVAKESDKAKEKEDDIPFACYICRESYRSPIVTKCNHYFCESCAIQRYHKVTSCAVCGASTNGVFNVAKGLRERLKKMNMQTPIDTKS